MPAQNRHSDVVCITWLQVVCLYIHSKTGTRSGTCLRPAAEGEVVGGRQDLDAVRDAAQPPDALLRARDTVPIIPNGLWRCFVASLLSSRSQ